MALRLISKRFTPLSKKRVNHGINNAFWLRKVVDKDSKILPFYRSVVSQLDSLGEVKNELTDLALALDRQDHEAALQKWDLVSKTPYSATKSPTLRELAEKYQCYGPPQLEQVITQLAKLPPPIIQEMWLGAKRAPVCAYLFPKVVERRLKKGDVDGARETLWALSRDAVLKREVQAVNFATSIYLHTVDVDLLDFVELVDGINPKIAPRLGETVIRKLAKLPRADLLPCFEYLQKRRIPMNKKGFGSFLRAVFASSDEAARAVVQGARTCEYPPGFYHFLTRYLCQTKDTEQLDWLFENSILKMARDMPGKLPFVLHLLVMRTIALDGIRATTPVLDKMGEVPESTWMIIFQEFRRLGRVDKCTETLHKALSRGHRLSLPFVGEYLEMVASFYSMPVYLKCLEKLLPEMSEVIAQLGIQDMAASQPVLGTVEMPPLSIGKEVRGFPVHRIHESWLNITYKVVLNNVDDVDAIVELFQAYRRYVLASRTPITLATVDEFVLKLTSLKTAAGVDAAEAILLSAIGEFRLQRAHKAANSCKSLAALLYALTRSNRHPDLQRAVLLVSKVLACPAVSARGLALKPLLAALENHDEQDSVKQWAEQLGARFG